MRKPFKFTRFLFAGLIFVSLLADCRAEKKVPPKNEEGPRSKISSLPYLQGYKAAPKKVGVTRHDKETAYQGLNFYLSGHAPRAYLTDMEGNVVHEWGLEYRDLPPGSGPGEGTHWRRAHLFPNGDLLAIYEGEVSGRGMPMVKLDKDSNLLWTYPGQCHHDLSVADNGNIYILTNREIDHHDRLQLKGPILEDRVTILNPEGKEIKSVSLLESFLDSDYASILNFMARDGDVFHTNTIELLDGKNAGRIPAFQRGRVLFSSRHLHAVAVVDLEEVKVNWMLWGMWLEQHQPTVLENGNLLIFDNKGERGRSKVIEMDPLNQEVRWAYRGDSKNNFYSATCGSNQRLPNGNTLITESESGRAFEVTPENRIVWEFLNPHRAGAEDELIATLFELIRVDPSSLSFLGRDTSTPARALLGHWRSGDGEELYLGPGNTDDLIGAVVVAPDGARREFEYRVHEQDFKEGTVVLYPGSKLGLFFIEGTFSGRFDKFSGSVGKREFSWEYIDGKREP